MGGVQKSSREIEGVPIVFVMSDMQIIKAAVIGLGNIGFQFNLDPKRKDTWSHVSAYEKADKTQLAGVVEIDEDKIDIFRQRYEDIPVFKTIHDLMEAIDIDMVSVCTPQDTHYSILMELLEYPLKAVFCEKPLASNIREAEELVVSYKEKKIVLAVNQIRRWEDSYLYVQKIIKDGKIGKVKAVNTIYPAQIFNIGTHLLDVIRMLIGKEPELASGISFNLNNPDPDISGWIMFSGQVPCTVITTGKREDLIFEIDILGDEGRIRVTENGDNIELYSFTESTRYSGYRELSSMQINTINRRDRFVESINDIVKALKDDSHTVSCTGMDGLYALVMSFAMNESARRNGEPIKMSATLQRMSGSDNYHAVSEKEENAEVSNM